MQLDMHYYATYAMARAAGIEPDDARIIATSAPIRRRQHCSKLCRIPRRLAY